MSRGMAIADKLANDVFYAKAERVAQEPYTCGLEDVEPLRNVTHAGI